MTFLKYNDIDSYIIVSIVCANASFHTHAVCTIYMRADQEKVVGVYKWHNKVCKEHLVVLDPYLVKFITDGLPHIGFLCSVRYNLEPFLLQYLCFLWFLWFSYVHMLNKTIKIVYKFSLQQNKTTFCIIYYLRILWFAAVWPVNAV